MSAGVKWIAFVKRKPGLSVEAFRTRWRAASAEPFLRIVGLRGYVQSEVLLSGYRKGEPFCDALAELWFADREALEVARASAAWAAARADAQELCEAAATIPLLTAEHLIKDGPKSPTGVKNVELVTRRRDLRVEEFHRYWLERHGPLAAKIPPILRYVQSHSIDDPNTRRYDGIASTWFENTDAMRHSATTPEYRYTRDDEANFVAGPLSFVITRERVVLEPPALA